MNPDQKVAVVTGSSSGIGYETSLALSRNRFLTYATMRNLNKRRHYKYTSGKGNTTDQSCTARLHLSYARRQRVSISKRSDIPWSKAGFVHQYIWTNTPVLTGFF